ncbi:hypothetical protein PTTG_05008 [Puccinia triticina 1-1 BBBD Race 1]|uniref:Dcp1p-Dcp2p decapping enzyme complex alpha subunit n=1 Tax=Puccinia triticina (isolate 1-1 / race 1 (BBBD)) TaxID=630390 RepID=A0A180GIM1_PUCT1|nr:hypothetical protein PTTG_05008 [Puccinia triticina 1-1 BBBD Race 1]
MEASMDDDLTPAEARKLFDDLRQEIANLKINQHQAQPFQPVAPHRSCTQQEMIMENFVKDPLKVHNQLNPRKPILVYKGTNFLVWEAALDRTIRHVLVRQENFTDKPENFNSLTVDKASTVTSLIRNTVVDTLGDIVDSSKLSNPKEVFELLKSKSSWSDPQQKIELLGEVVSLLNDPAPATDSTLSVWARLKSELAQPKLTWDEALGILLQAYFKPPVGVDPIAFESTVSQQLNEKRLSGF